MNTATIEPTTAASPSSPLERWNQLSKARRILLIAGLGVVLLSVTRIISGADDLTSSGTVGTTLRLTMPLLMAGMAGLFAERVGIVNIGIEGMMIMGTWAGGFGAWKFGPWIGLLLGILGGVIGGLIHALATVTFNVDHIISGVAINLFAFGGMRYLSELVFEGEQGGGISQSPQQKSAIPKFDLPFLAGGDIGGWKSPDVLGWFEDRQWFLVGDLAGLIRGVISDLSWATLICLALVPLSWFYLWRTRFGLRHRSSGEAPEAAESLGIKVLRVRWIGLAMSGGFAGLGGAYLSIIASSYYRQGQTANRGYIGLATMIFGNWRPAGLLGGAGLFGFSEALKLRRADSLPALFLFVALVAAMLVVVSYFRKRMINAITAAIVGAVFLLTYLMVDEVSESLTQATPYLVTLIVLATASQRLRPPAHAGLPYP